jgi:hypothetical protein
MTTPTPSQIAELTHRLKHETWSGFQNLAMQASTALTEQATEIAELKAKLTEQTPITDEQLRELHHIEEFGLFCSYEEFEQIARAIEQLLKD